MEFETNCIRKRLSGRIPTCDAGYMYCDDKKCKFYTPPKKEMINKKTWEDFKGTGLLLFINQILHAFGWAICFEYEEDGETLKLVYPARVRFRGFDNKNISNSYQKLSKYMLDNAEELYEESCE